MVEVIGLPGSPLRKQADEHAARVAELELVIGEQRALLERQAADMRRAEGTRDLLRLQLADLGMKLDHLTDQIMTAKRNVEGLQKRLTEEPPNA